MSRILSVFISIIAIIVIFLLASIVAFNLIQAIVFTIVLLLLVGISYFATQDARKRGFSEIQVFLLRVACVIFFPISLILYLIFRPALKGNQT
jgi:hypothetical protein